ncbi:MAG TPA: LytTR family DNA-binding domain-containing protein [Saprospiraceae bacterium]|nr:LytTR family DNA-binding domain-containing protein [Saprospiraceae bacterium]HRG20289.1 LytTR family DNA-binding domain-containing protein [Saprospiraceae bacterium]HRG64153.1 LytTR family DNA-binding domain-containing protein [Saprospiraceae bacterium]
MKAVIVEDEIIIANVLKNKIEKLDAGIDIIEILTSKQTALEWLRSNSQPDVMFMDIQLSDGVSFDIFKEYELSCPIIFTTAYDEYALKAFKVNGIDYLLKPIQESELEAAIQKLKKQIDAKENIPNALKNILSAFGKTEEGSSYKEIFMADHKNQKLPINVKDIACFCKDVINCIYLFNGEKYYLDYITLDEIEKLLDPKHFFRVNRQFIINIQAIHSIKSLNNSKIDVFLKSPNQALEIDVSRMRCPDFRKWVNR